MLKKGELCGLIGFDSKTSGKKMLKHLEELRNNLAHSQDIITRNWPGIADLAAKAEEIFHKCEEVNATH